MNFYSVKMRSSKIINGKKTHISGAENIVKEDVLEEISKSLIKRALNHDKGKSESINIKIEKIHQDELTYIEPLKVQSIEVKDRVEGLKACNKLLTLIGINEEKAKFIIDMLTEIKDMRGAILLDVNTLKRLEPDKERGLRATFMDLEYSTFSESIKHTKKSTHFIEALVLASKVISCPYILGEICYSDDPNYTAGYIASKKFGYVRFTHMKDLGNPFGGRIFLYDSKKENINDCIDYIENKKIIVKENIIKNSPLTYKEFMDKGL
ncbi:MAG: 6-carboxyhexanoate--CoA ligase [Clostridium perfringens]|nr:6-carboxyhexanoate--CoA ligase [Clostridium perfringens]